MWLTVKLLKYTSLPASKEGEVYVPFVAGPSIILNSAAVSPVII